MLYFYFLLHNLCFYLIYIFNIMPYSSQFEFRTTMGALDEHVADQIAAVEETLTHVDEVFGNLDSVDYDEVVKNMSPLERAKYDLTNLYAINSLFWMYMRSFGENPHSGAMKDELDRIKQQMIRASEIANKSKMPRVNKEVANRMIKHELWEPNNTSSVSTVSKTQSNELDGENWEEEEEEEPMETDANKSRKRKLEDVPKSKSSSSTSVPSNPSRPASSTSSSSADEEEEGEVESTEEEEQ